jgi:hypothetical protein
MKMDEDGNASRSGDKEPGSGSRAPVITGDYHPGSKNSGRWARPNQHRSPGGGKYLETAKKGGPQTAAELYAEHRAKLDGEVINGRFVPSKIRGIKANMLS